MRILVVHNRYRQAGGEERVVELESTLLRDRGHTVETWFWDSADIASFPDKFKTAWNLPHSVPSLQICQEKITSFRPDIVHVHNFFPRITPAIHDAAKSMRVPSVQTLHNYRLICANGLFLRAGKSCELCLDESSSWPAVQNACYNESRVQSFAMSRLIEKNRNTWAEKVTRFIVLTNFAKDRYVKFGIPEKSISVKPNFIPDPLVGGDPRPMQSRKKQVLYVGRLSEEKGIQDLLQAWSSTPEWELHIVGSGPLSTELQSKYQGTDIFFHGWKDQDFIFSKMAEASLLVFPSRCYENFPISILEAMASGTPILSARTGGLPEIIRDSVDAVFYQGASDLAVKLGDLLQDELLRQKIALSARNRYLENYSREANALSLEKIYSEVLA